MQTTINCIIFIYKFNLNAATQIYRNFEKVRKIKKTKNRKKLKSL